MLIINRYTCPINGKISIQAHVIENSKLVKSYSKMITDDISLFSNYDTILVCDVVRASNLPTINLINQ